MAKRRDTTKLTRSTVAGYDGLIGGISKLLDESRRATARAINGVLTATYWEVGRRIVHFEQGGKARAEYGAELLKRLGEDLTGRFGRGFSDRNLRQMRMLYLDWEIWQTLSAKLDGGLLTTAMGLERHSFQTPSGIFEARVKLPPEYLEADSNTGSDQASGLSIVQTVSAQFTAELHSAFPLSWSHYVRLMSVEKLHARAFYEAEAIHGGWSVRQLDRQIATQFFERTSQSRQQAALLTKGRKPPRPEDAIAPDDEIRDPYLLEFLNLKDEYSESELEAALIEHLEAFLLELGAGFTFVARQKRIRVGNAWYRIDLLLYHRGLRCLVVIDLKTGAFNHADAGQMNLYLNYVKERMTMPDEADPVGIILCDGKDDAVVHYAMGGINARVFASKYMTQLPDVATLRKEIETTKRALLQHQSVRRQGKRK
jgi:predicted nuclease of restriction endonuclease-like (RecB) superfamily